MSIKDFILASGNCQFPQVIQDLPQELLPLYMPIPINFQSAQNEVVPIMHVDNFLDKNPDYIDAEVVEIQEVKEISDNSKLFEKIV